MLNTSIIQANILNEAKYTNTNYIEPFAEHVKSQMNLLSNRIKNETIVPSSIFKSIDFKQTSFESLRSISSLNSHLNFIVSKNVNIEQIYMFSSENLYGTNQSVSKNLYTKILSILNGLEDKFITQKNDINTLGIIPNSNTFLYYIYFDKDNDVCYLFTINTSSFIGLNFDSGIHFVLTSLDFAWSLQQGGTPSEYITDTYNKSKNLTNIFKSFNYNTLVSAKNIGNDLRIVCYLNLANLSIKWNNAKFFLYIIAIISCLFSIFMSILFSKMLFSPINYLIANLDNANSFRKIDIKAILQNKHKLLERFNFLSMKTKVFCFSFILTLIPILTFFISLLAITPGIIKDKAESSYQNILNITSKSILYQFESTEQLVDNLILSKSIQDLFIQGTDMEAKNKSALRFINELNPNYYNIIKISIYDKSHNLITSTSTLPINNIKKESADLNWSINNSRFAKDISILKPIRNYIYTPYDNKKATTDTYYSIVGYIDCSLDQTAILNYLNTLSLNHNIVSFIVDENKKIVMHQDDFFLDKDMNSLYSEILKTNVNFSFPINNTTLSLVCILPKEIQKNNYDELFLYNLVILLILIIISTIVSILISKKLSKDISNIENEVLFKSNSLSTLSPLYSGSSTEIITLVNCFNDMILRIRNLLEKNHQTEIEKELLERKKKESELIAFQTQINPHFLYNTFSSINIMIKQKKNEDAYKMLTSLGNMLKTSIYRGSIIVPVEDEIKNLEYYLEIQKYRFKEKLNIIWSISPEVYVQSIPKLTLQPIVENAIYHGTENKSEAGTIEIKAYANENFLIFEISDDGIGIDPGNLQSINDQLKNNATSKKLGLINVNQRIKLYFGEEYGIFINSKNNIGTTVTLRFPIR